ncbi:hypothetical protein SALBM135S_05382 [Streptomyces alboniger]
MPPAGVVCLARGAGQQRLTAVRGQHDALMGLPGRGLPRIGGSSALTALLRHRDSYVWGTYGTVGSRYRVAAALCHAAQNVALRSGARSNNSARPGAA